MSFYYTDEVLITRISRGEYREELEDMSFTSEAYVEDDNRIVYGADGQPIKPAQMIFLPYETKIDEGDSIQIIKQFGESVDEQPKRVTRVFRSGSIIGDHLEVRVG